MNVSKSEIKSIVVLILFSAIVLSGAVLPVSADATTVPNRFSGAVMLNGISAPIGTTIEASIGGEPRGSTVVESPGTYEYLTVHGSASDDGMTVTFTVGGLHADQTTTWIAMIDHVRTLNLTAGDAPTGDTTFPVITITAPAPDASFTTADITVDGTASDESLDNVQVKVGSGDWTDVSSGTTSWSTSVTLDLGPNTIYARANDTSGNSREVQVDNVSYVVEGSGDTTPPNVSIESPSGGDTFTTTTITVSGTASDNKGVHKVQVNIGGGWKAAEGTTKWSKIVTMSYGMHTIEVRAVDDAGLSSETQSITVARNPSSGGGSSSGGSVIDPRATPAGADAQPVSGNATSVTSTSTITESNAPATTSAKEPATKPEAKGLPGFEAMFSIAGLLAVAYMLIRR